MATEPRLGDSPADFHEARRRLDRAATGAAERLGQRLQQASELHGLDRAELMASQRQIRRLRRIGALPSPTDYWDSTAVPRAELLIESATTAIDEETGRLADAIDRFLMATSRSTLEPWINGAEGRAAIQSSGTGAIERVLAALPNSEPIDALGEWWQGRLHRWAILRSLPLLVVSTATTEAVVGEAEVHLLDSPPWSYGDRLLSAFELANAEIRARAIEATEGLTRRVDRRGHRSLVEPGTDGPAIIKLNG